MLCGKFNGIVILQASLQQKMKFCIKNFFNKCNQIRSLLRIWSVTFTEKILNGKRHFFVQCLTFFTFIENIWQLGRIIKASIHHDTSGWLEDTFTERTGSRYTTDAPNMETRLHDLSNNFDIKHVFKA